MTFWAVFAGVLGANLLTVACVWSVVNLSRREAAGQHGGNGLYLGVFVATMLFALSGIMIATDSVPAWLDAISQ